MSGHDKKVLLVVAGTAAVVLILLAGGAAFWLSFNVDEIRSAGSQLQAEGRELGTRTDPNGCLSAALERLDSASGLTGEVAVHLFLQACLGETRPMEGFCNETPAVGAVFDSAMWQLERCRREGQENNQPCTRLMGVVQRFCEESREAGSR